MKQIYRTFPFDKNNLFDKIIFFIKISIVLFLSLILIIIKFICDLLIPRISIVIPKFFHKLIVWLINIKIIKEGNIINNGKGILFVSNHLSYLDIPILGSLLSAKFVAKQDISNWLFFGRLAKIGNTIFIKRKKKNIFEQKDIIRNEMDNGFKVILFPEGTTSDGVRVLKFKSSLFSSVEKKNYLIQPVVIKYETINGLPLNRWLKPIIAWYGDMELKIHLSDILNLFSISTRVIFLNPVSSKDFKDRKSMTFTLQSVIFKEYSRKTIDN